MPVWLLLALPAQGRQFVAQSSSPGLWRVNGGGAPVAIGTNPNWSSFAASGVGWMVPVANSHVNNVGVGAFTYTTTFDLTNHQRLTFRQDVQTLADDVVSNVVLNGTRLSSASNGFGTPGGFQILGGSRLLLPGVNTIAITVNNVIVSPTGLSVRSAFASVTPVPAFFPARPRSRAVR